MKRFYIIFLLMIIIIVGVLGVLYFFPILVIKDVEVSGNENLETSFIIKQAGIEIGDTNIVSYNVFSAAKKLKAKNPFIKNISVVPVYPNKITITIEENSPRGYISYINSYLCINEEGKVLDIVTEPKKNIPIVSGLEFKNITKGEILKVENSRVFSILIEISNLMKKYDMEYNDLNVNISDPEDLHIYINNIDVFIGNTDDINRKISVLTEVLKEIGEDEKGFLYLNDINSEIRFQYLT